jgi:hypothetical protein
MSETIYVKQDGKALVRMKVQAYDKEIDFQQLLQDYPELLSGDQINPASPRKWLLVGREAAVPSESGGDSRWSLDLLFLDQDSVPTLVEVKRKSDSRLRREVVGQMLDYAANAVSYWPADALHEQFVNTCAKLKKDPIAELDEFLNGADQNAFWQLAQTKLRAGEVRLLFVADQIPSELQRIVEFLNERMSPTEVLALEIRRYAGEGLSTHIPRILGQTSEALLTKTNGMPTGGGTTKRSTWKHDERTFFDQAHGQLNTEDIAAIEKVFVFAQKWSARLEYGSGKEASFSPKLEGISARAPITVWAKGPLEIKLDWLNDMSSSTLFREAFQRELELVGLPSELKTHKLAAAEWVPRIDDLLKACDNAILAVMPV